MVSPIRPSTPGATAGPTFEQPFEMMVACHERLGRTLALLQRLREHLGPHGADEQARQAASDVMRYFDRAAPQHHQDEELHVFPPLLQQGEADTVEVVRQLQQDHQRMETLWAAARAVLQAIADGQRHQLGPDDEEMLDAFAVLYGEHLRAEELIVYPRSRALLDAQAIAGMGREMSKRRGNP
ncbi:MAG TPA: hemerythrin domain-containing protein [Ramlibacter sp.]|nr:hemerythrin domain-containing protein [Ramlibacter sp.]